MVTSYGKILRKIRIDEGEILGEMAQKLEISSAYLSSIENGDRNLPDGFTEKISQIYSLKKNVIKQLKSAEKEYIREARISLKNTSPIKRETALIFARTFNSMDDEDMKAIKQLLARKEKKNSEV